MQNNNLRFNSVNISIIQIMGNFNAFKLWSNFFSNNFQIYGSFPTYIGRNETIFVLVKLFLHPAKRISRTPQESFISF